MRKFLVLVALTICVTFAVTASQGSAGNAEAQWRRGYYRGGYGYYGRPYRYGAYGYGPRFYGGYTPYANPYAYGYGPGYYGYPGVGVGVYSPVGGAYWW